MYIYIPWLTGTITQVQTAPLNYLYRQGDWVQNDLYQFHFLKIEFQFYDLLLVSVVVSELLSTAPINV